VPLNYVTVTGTFRDGSGAPLTGAVTFTPSQPVYAAGVPLVTPGIPVTAEISGGALVTSSDGPLSLLATDNPGLALQGRTGFWFWQVAVALAGFNEDGWEFFLPWSVYGSSPYDGTVDLYALANSQVPGGGGGSGSVTSVSVEEANGFAGTVADSTTTPQVTLSTTVSGLLMGADGALEQAAAGTDYLAPGGSGAALTGITAAQAGAASTTALGNEVTRATAAEGTLSTAVSAEVTRAEGAEGTLSTAVGAETTRAEAAEGGKVARSGDTMTGPLAPKVVTLTQSAGSVAVPDQGNVFALALTASGWTIALPTGMADGQAFRLRLAQDSTGGRTVTWASGWDWGAGNSAPALSTAASAVDVLGFEWHAGLGKALYAGAPFPQGF
jgi:hypothetical protein